MSISVNLILDTRRLKQRSNKFPVKLRVTSNRKSKDFQTVYDLSVEDFEKLSAARVSAELKHLREVFKDIERTAENFIKERSLFCFNDFQRNFILKNNLFRTRKMNTDGVVKARDGFDFSIFKKKFPILNEDQHIPDAISTVYISITEKLLLEGRIGNALNYQDSYNSLKKFNGNVRFNQISVIFLNLYEQWMFSRNCSKSTIGIKLRHLRAVFNEAIDSRIISRDDCYPFGRRKYQIPSSKNIKKALNIADLSKIYSYQTNNIDTRKARDYWLFCYLSNGINPKDVALLRFKNIQDDYIILDRAKTERTSRSNPRPVIIYVNDDIKAIIERWGNKNRSSENYIFPILTSGLSSLEQHFAIKAFNKFINDGMAKVQVELGIERKLTTIVSRHTFSTQLKRSGASTEFIQEALGHTDVRTTESYLDSFENNLKKEFSKKLTEFKNLQNDLYQIE